jgi:outer membrane lipoprotein SlyB
MKKLALAGLLALSAVGAMADNPHGLPPGIAKKMHATGCENCAHVNEVRQEKRKGSGGAVGIVGGAVVGGLLGNQIGKGTGNTVATVGGAVAGGFAGNEVQKRVSSKTVWVTRVTLRDGSVRSFEQEAQPAWKAGSLVKVQGNSLAFVS